MISHQLDTDEFDRRAKRIRLLILDVDGVLTDGSIVYDESGREIKRFHVRDGFAIRSWQRAGHKVAVLSGRFSQAVAIRCRELGIEPIVQSSPQKGPAYWRILDSVGCRAEEVCVLGDDLPDLPMLLASGIGAAVADADPQVVGVASWVTRASGGRGAVRELVERLLTSQGRWQEVIDHYSIAAARTLPQPE